TRFHVTGVQTCALPISNPERGLVFVISNDWPSFYQEMELRRPDDPPPAQGGFGGFGGGGGPGGPGGGAGAAALIAQGEQLYQAKDRKRGVAGKKAGDRR